MDFAQQRERAAAREENRPWVDPEHHEKGVYHNVPPATEDDEAVPSGQRLVGSGWDESTGVLTPRGGQSSRRRAADTEPVVAAAGSANVTFAPKDDKPASKSDDKK